jgi:cytoskeletal protein RodZ
MPWSQIFYLTKHLADSRESLKEQANQQQLLEIQKKSIQELGLLLRETRICKNLAPEEAATESLIRLGLLLAIESGNFEQLPEPVYIQGLIRQYANVLGLNGEQLAKQIPIDIVDLPQPKRWWVLPQVIQLYPVHLYVAYVVVMAIAIHSLSRSLGNNTAEITIPLSPPIITESPKPIPSISPSATPTQPVTVAMTLKSQSWLRITSDGKIEFEGVLEEGTQRTWTAQTKLVIRSGNAGAVMISFNGQASRPLGNRGDVHEATFVPSPPEPNPKSGNDSN